MTKVVAFTGAGISKASGIPTFEEMGDLRDKLSRTISRVTRRCSTQIFGNEEKIDEAKAQ